MIAEGCLRYVSVRYTQTYNSLAEKYFFLPCISQTLRRKLFHTVVLKPWLLPWGTLKSETGENIVQRCLDGTCFTTNSHIIFYYLEVGDATAFGWKSAGKFRLIVGLRTKGNGSWWTCSIWNIYYLYIHYIVGWLLEGFPKSMTFRRFLSNGWYTEVSTALGILCYTKKGGLWLKLSHSYYIVDFLFIVWILYSMKFTLWQKAFTFSLHCQCFSTEEVCWWLSSYRILPIFITFTTLLSPREFSDVQ